MKFMKRALFLAEKGRGSVSPNPMVGAVIEHNGRIIGEGYHPRLGGNHGEIEAINSVKAEDRVLLKDSTLYCNLEPCSKIYPGKRKPPCCDTIIDIGIPRVVIAHLDPNPMVSGSGVKRLRNAGVKVDIGLLSEEAKNLNQGFLSVITKKRPYIHLKWAQSLDGKIATGAGISKWITSESCREDTHFHRSKCDGIIVGTGTLLADNPSLDARYGFSPSPRPVVIDKNLNLNRSLKVFKREPLIITNRESQGDYIQYSGERFNIESILELLPERGISSLFVEGGANLLTQFFKKGLWDRVTIYIAPKLLGEGISPLANIGVNHPGDANQFTKSELTTMDNHFIFNGWA